MNWNWGETGERVRRSTVEIQRQGRRGGTGSGFMWSNDGRVLTNAHVVDGAASLSVELWDGRVVRGELLAADTAHDLALVRIHVVVPRLELRSEPPTVGEEVIAIGSPLGFTGAMTKGTVRHVGSIRGLGKRDWVQATIRLAPGNSGGPLADIQGRVVGINSMVVGPGIALAIPAHAALRFAQNGPAPRLGVTIRDVKVDGRQALLVLEVASGGAADKASLLIGDIIVSVNGSRVEGSSDLADQLAQSVERAGGLARVQFLRGDRNRLREVVVTLQSAAFGKAA
jgi:serine protease Do